MDESEIDRVTSVAKLFRAAIQQCDHSELIGFPAGCCGQACQLLGTYFLANGISGFRCVEGSLGKWFSPDEPPTAPSHAWLERDGLIVDITADQYDGIDEAVIVSKTSDWHERFQEDRSTPADFRDENDPKALASWNSMYDAILSNI